ncbi:MAG TPA: preprotein translocase subunit SecA [Rhodothermales bacterium]|nr:preprotein translocase subunit SecA [Rhodothermales bacterium]
MLKFIQKVFGGSPNERELKKLWPLVDEINGHYKTLQNLTDEELRAKTAEFKSVIRKALEEIEADKQAIELRLRGVVDSSGDGAPAAELSLEDRMALYQEIEKLDKEWQDTLQITLDQILPEAFAVIKETCRRFVGKEWMAGGTMIRWDMVPYDVQLLGGIVLHKGRIAEMKTGEGKTLVAVAPVYLNALSGRGVHLVTVNPYLAQRDMEWMRPIFEFHDLKVGCIDQSEPHSEGRKAAYDADITYGTNNEFGFDYLRDNSFVVEPEHLMQRAHNFAIVDEIDSVLIDEARTPLIISGPVPQATEGQFAQYKPFVQKLVDAQVRLVARFVADAEKHLAANKADDAGLALLRAHRGFPKNKALTKLKTESGVAPLLQKTEYFYLQDNAKRMPEVDEALYYAVDEKNHSLEMTEMGRKYVAQLANHDENFFVLPDVGEGIARIKAEIDTEIAAAEKDWASLEGEERDNIRREVLRRAELNRQEKERQLYAEVSEKADRIHAVNQLLRAYTYYEKDIEYIVEEDKILIVDEQTGRVLPGRRYSDGLHQAIEAKENVKVQAATQTYATITLQNYFRLYAKLAGMTGTAETESAEFFSIYKLEVNVIPTNRSITRKDMEDLVFRTKREKYNAVLDKIAAYQQQGQPVLVGTTSVEVSEMLSRLLTRKGIKHNVLNAKVDRAKAEALIVAEAGQRGAVTIATNMAGRGTDIKLAQGISDLGGLAILGTERHESRRIDLQLRGRSGRQGDPGESQFYVSLEDDLMRLFGHDRTAKVMDKMGMEEGEVITHPWVTKSIERAQTKVEQNHFSTRKRQLEFDDVLNAQRHVIYDRRMHALKGERLRGDILQMLQDTCDEIARQYVPSKDLDGLRDEVLRQFALVLELDPVAFQNITEKALSQSVYKQAEAAYHAKRQLLAESFHHGVEQMIKNATEPPEKIVVDFTDGRKILRVVVDVAQVLATNGQEVNDALERAAILSTIDDRWVEHLRELDDLKEGIYLRAYGQKDPLVEYKVEAFNLFTDLLNDLNEQALSIVFRSGLLVQERERAETVRKTSRLDSKRAKATQAKAESGFGAGADDVYREGQAKEDPTVKQAPVVRNKEEKISRNDQVKVMNPTTGEVVEMKYKKAQQMIQKGWSLVR